MNQQHSKKSFTQPLATTFREDEARLIVAVLGKVQTDPDYAVLLGSDEKRADFVRALSKHRRLVAKAEQRKGKAA